MDLNALFNADLSGVSIELPEGLGNRIVELMSMTVELNTEIAEYLYGPEYTDEQLKQAGLLAILYGKKYIDDLCDFKQKE